MRKGKLFLNEIFDYNFGYIGDWLEIFLKF